jgi:hypothetical protein
VNSSIAILRVLIAVPVALIKLVVSRRAAARHPLAEQEMSLYAALWIECEGYRQQVAKDVAWRLNGRRGDAPFVGSANDFEALGFAVAVQSPGPIAKAAGALFQQTELLGKTFVRDRADSWMPDPEEWEAMLADWQIRARDYAQLAHVDLDRTGGDSGDAAHRHLWGRTYTIRPRRTGGWLLEYGGNPSEIVVLPEGTFFADGREFRECVCGTWESRNGRRGQWKVESGNAPSPRLQILTQQPGPDD